MDNGAGITLTLQYILSIKGINIKIFDVYYV